MNDIKTLVDEFEVPVGTGVHVHVASSGEAHIEITRNVTPHCGRCEEPLDMTVEPGPTTFYDQFGVKSGEGNFQHGCGGWNQPESVERVVWDDLTENSVEDIMHEMLTELESLCDIEIARVRERAIEEGKRWSAELNEEFAAVPEDDREQFIEDNISDGGDGCTPIRFHDGRFLITVPVGWDTYGCEDEWEEC